MKKVSSYSEASNRTGSAFLNGTSKISDFDSRRCCVNWPGRGLGMSKEVTKGNLKCCVVTTTCFGGEIQVAPGSLC